MAYEDPFAVAPTNTEFDTANKETAPVTETSAASAVVSASEPFNIGFTLKSAGGFEAEWLTPRVSGTTAIEAAERGRDLLVAMQEVGLIDLTAKAAHYTRSQYIAPEKPTATANPTFQGGKVQYNGGGGGGGGAKPDNVPDGFTYKEGTNKNGKPYKGWFPPRGVEAAPIWV